MYRLTRGGRSDGTKQRSCLASGAADRWPCFSDALAFSHAVPLRVTSIARFWPRYQWRLGNARDGEPLRATAASSSILVQTGSNNLIAQGLYEKQRWAKENDFFIGWTSDL